MYDYLIYFLVFSFLGWCAEVIFYAFKEHRFVNRGLARGPICPIYGVGISLSYLMLRGVESFLALVLLSMALTTLVEALVGVLTHKMLGVRLWDYRSERGNIGGYVCPRFSLLWGVISALIIRMIPRLDPLLELANDPRVVALVFAFLILAFADTEREMIRIIRGDMKPKT